MWRTLTNVVLILTVGVALGVVGLTVARVWAQAQNTGAPVMAGTQQWFDSSGNPLNTGTIATYISGGSTSAVTYSDRDLNVRNANPVVLNAAGRAAIFLAATQLYRLVFADSSNANQITMDGIAGANYIAEAHALDIGLCNGRITLTSGVPVTTASVANATTVYFTPYQGNRCALYDGANWRQVTFTEVSLSLGSDAANTNYDLFAYLVGTTFTLERLSWTNNLDRTTNLAYQNGALVRSGAATRRYLGTYRTTGTAGRTEDSLERRFVWNYYNPVPRLMRVLEDTNSWTYTTATYRQVNGSSANALAFVTGDTTLIQAAVTHHASNTGTGINLFSSIGDGDRETPIAGVIGANVGGLSANGTGLISASAAQYARVGFHTWIWLEKSAASGTTSWYGDNGSTVEMQSGILGWVKG